MDNTLQKIKAGEYVLTTSNGKYTITKKPNRDWAVCTQTDSLPLLVTNALAKVEAEVIKWEATQEFKTFGSKLSNKKRSESEADLTVGERKEKRKQYMKQRWSNMSEEQRAHYREYRQARWNNRTEEQKAADREYRRQRYHKLKESNKTQ